MFSAKWRADALRLTVAYLVVYQFTNASLFYLRSSHRAVGKASGNTGSASLHCLRARFARWHGELCGQFCPLKFAG